MKGRLAARHFLGLGRRRALFLGNIEHSKPADRLDGFVDEFVAGTGELLDAVRCPFTFDGGNVAMKAGLAAHGARFDAVFAGCDAIALGAVRALVEAGRRVGEEVSVVGFDDAASASVFSPPLTTVHQDWREGGRQLARKAMALIEGESAGNSILPVRLITRAT